MRLEMKTNSTNKIYWIPLLAAALSILYFAATRLQHEIKDQAREFLRTIKITINGESHYAQTQLSQQMAQKKSAATTDITHIETAVLPLEIYSAAINATLPYPLGAGSMTKVDNYIIIMDRLGSLYKYENNKITRADTPHIPNGIDDFIIHSQNKSLDIDTFRTHSISYSEAQQALYASYEKYVDPAHNRFEISSIKFDPHTQRSTGNWSIKFKSEEFSSKTFGLAGGGKILTAGDRTFFAVGDYGFYADKTHPEMHAAQNPKTSFGKIFEIHSDGSIEMLSLGHRNTQGLVFTTENQLINVEQGPQGGDEINIIEKGNNYGWPIETFGTDYGKYTWQYQNNNQSKKLQSPLYSFVPSVAADSIVQLSDFNSRWDGDFLVGSLKAQTLFRLKIKENRVLLIEPIWIGHRIREIVTFPGRIVLMTDDGLLMTILVNQSAFKEDKRGIDSVANKSLSKCLACHHMGPTNPSHLAPTLSNLGSRPIASDTFDKYSTSLRNSKGSWDKDRLREFLANPARTVPGTAMPKPELSKDELEDVLNSLFSNQ